jgi:AcrR family transcriptional regulator
MATVVSRESYFDTGFEVLSDSGYGGLKLAEVVGRLGVTTGSFYHYFTSWSTYTTELLDNWVEARTVRTVERARTEPDPRQRIDTLIQEGLALPHGAEAAIRVWGSIDPEVYSRQLAVDQQRFDILFESAFEVLQHKHQAKMFASWAIYLLVGYEQAALPRDPADLEWIAGQLLEALDSGRFATVPDGD